MGQTSQCSCAVMNRTAFRPNRKTAGPPINEML